MEIEEKLDLSYSLLRQLDFEVNRLDPSDENLEEILTRATHARLKMKSAFDDCQLPQLLEQIKFLESVIFKLQTMHNKQVEE